MRGLNARHENILLVKLPNLRTVPVQMYSTVLYLPWYPGGRESESGHAVTRIRHGVLTQATARSRGINAAAIGHGRHFAQRADHRGGAAHGGLAIGAAAARAGSTQQGCAAVSLHAAAGTCSAMGARSRTQERKDIPDAQLCAHSGGRLATSVEGAAGNEAA